MDPNEDYPSDSDASDEDFRPDKDEGSGSELESDDNVEEHENGDEEAVTATGGKKRKQTGKKGTKKKAKTIEEVPEEKETEKKEEENEEDEEALTDALWADFLAGSNSSTSSSSKEPAKKAPAKTAVPPVKVQKPTQTTKPETVTKIFEFAGETVEVTEPAPSGGASVEAATKPEPKPATLGALSSNGGGPPRPTPLGRSSGGGLGAVLGQLGKKNKLSVLEKTQLDWKSFKRNEGIEEELQTHNRGRDGYLERQDFLQRADLRQFEIEKNFRQSKSKR